MPLNIKDPETDRLARQLAKATGETVTDAVRIAVAERLKHIAAKGQASVRSRIEEIARRCAALPDLDTREADAILGYNAQGHFD